MYMTIKSATIQPIADQDYIKVMFDTILTSTVGMDETYRQQLVPQNGISPPSGLVSYKQMPMYYSNRATVLNRSWGLNTASRLLLYNCKMLQI